MTAVLDADKITRDETPVSFFNPLKDDVAVEWRDDDNKIHIITLKALEISTLPAYKATMLKKHLCDAVINDRGIGLATDKELEQIKKELDYEP